MSKHAVKKKINWVVASSNKGKLQEFTSFFERFSINLSSQNEFGIEACAENGATFVENAIVKARHVTRLSGRPALADDSGLVVAALNGAPGIYSARYAGTHASAQDNNEKLLLEMAGVPIAKRTAYFYCVLVLLRDENDPTPIICEGRWQGIILEKPQGCQGFGYDPLFFIPSLNKAAAELPLVIKNQVSHRALAMQALTKRVSEWL